VEIIHIFFIMKIAFIGQKGVPTMTGGVEMHVERLALGLKKRGHDVYVYCRPWYTVNEPKTYKGLNLIYKNSVKTKNLDAITHVLLCSIDAVRRNYDIVHYHGVGPALLSWIPRLFCLHTKVVVTFHSIDRTHQKWSPFARLFLKLGEFCAVKIPHETIAVSRVLQRYCKKIYGERVIYVPNGVNKSARFPARKIKKKWGLNSGGYIMFMSRLVRHKGVHYLIDAYDKLKTDKKLVIVGGSSFTDDYVDEIKLKAEGNPNIIFIGSVKAYSQEWHELFSNCYMFVHPSESEGLPIVVLEAMSFGNCVLASDIPQNVEAISGGYGFQFRNKSVRSLYKQMQYLLQRPRMVKKVGGAAKVHVRNNYDWDGIIKSVEHIYECVYYSSSEKRASNCVHRIKPLDV